MYVAENVAKDFVGPNLLGWRTVQMKLSESVHKECAAAPGRQAEVAMESISELPELLRG